MSDQPIRELERLFRHTGSPHDEADWIVARAKTGELQKENLLLASALGHTASRIAFPDVTLATDSIHAWFEACRESPTATERSGFAFAISLIESETETEQQDWHSLLNSEQRECLRLLAKFAQTLNQDNIPIGKLVVLECAREAVREVTHGPPPNVIELVMQRLVYALSPDTQNTVLELVLNPPAQEATLAENEPQATIAVMQRALFPWLLHSYDPIDTIVKRLE